MTLKLTSLVLGQHPRTRVVVSLPLRHALQQPTRKALPGIGRQQQQLLPPQPEGLCLLRLGL